MAMQDVLDQLSERFAEVKGRITESQIFNNVREKYETLSPAAQKGVVFGGSALVALILISFPISYFTSSSSTMDDYDNTRQLIRGFLRAKSIASEASSLPPTISSEELKARIQNDLASMQLLPEQIGGVADLELEKLGSPLAPGSISQNAVGLTLKKLNLKQIVEIGYQMQNLNPTVKLAGVEINANTPDPHYFDVLFKFVIFNMPTLSNDSESSDPRGGKPQMGGKNTAKGPGPTGNKAPPQFRDKKSKPSIEDEE